MAEKINDTMSRGVNRLYMLILIISIFTGCEKENGYEIFIEL